MANDSKYKPGKSGNPPTSFQAGNPHRWQPGQSGNPAGIARSRVEFEECFYASLISQGDAEEAASLLWECARKHEPWAIQALLQRLAPETKQIKLTHGVDNEPALDYTRLSADEEALFRLQILFAFEQQPALFKNGLIVYPVCIPRGMHESGIEGGNYYGEGKDGKGQRKRHR